MAGGGAKIANCDSMKRIPNPGWVHLLNGDASITSRYVGSTRRGCCINTGDVANAMKTANSVPDIREKPRMTT